MRHFIVYSFALLLSLSTWADPSATVDVTLSPAGSFKGKTSQVKGQAILKGDTVTASNLVVNLGSLKTGIDVRDTHTLKHLEVSKYPEAILVSATGRGGKGEGLIRIKGIEQKISGTYTVKGSELVADFPLHLSDFKIVGLKYMGIGVKDEVKLHVVVPIAKN
jgi:hypothetical protein